MEEVAVVEERMEEEQQHGGGVWTRKIEENGIGE